MNNLFANPLLKAEQSKMLQIIFFTAPMLNFLFGISTDMYTPALPSIQVELNTSYFDVLKSLNSFMLGFFISCLVIGPIIDKVGTRKILIISLVLFIINCILTFIATKIGLLQALRLFQGVLVGCFSVASRVLIVLHFTDKKYQVGITYTSLAYGVGVILGPLLGSYVTFNLGWRYIFITYIIFSLIILYFLVCYIPNTKGSNTPASIKECFILYLKILSNKSFLSAGIILGFVMFQELSFAIFMPYFFLEELNVPLLDYGRETMLLGCSFLIGVLTNKRLLLKTTLKKSTIIGYLIWFTGVITYVILAYTIGLSQKMVLIASIIIIFSIGFVFPNVLGYALKINPDNVGMSASAQSMLFMLVCTLLTGLSNKLNFISIQHLALFFLLLFLVQVALFLSLIYKKMLI